MADMMYCKEKMAQCNTETGFSLFIASTALCFLVPNNSENDGVKHKEGTLPNLHSNNRPTTINIRCWEKRRPPIVRLKYQNTVKNFKFVHQHPTNSVCLLLSVVMTGIRF